MKDAPSTASCCRIKGDDQGVEVTVRTSKVRLESSLRRSNKATLLQHQQGYLWISHSSKKNVEQTRRIVWSLWEKDLPRQQRKFCVRFRVVEFSNN
ncbi:hypothetical protein TNIN_189261 [Trichonephila inaurata madagascariensis]|uniref:Uncharacterized protein n=1 Tax=Trichonephila inaurata madagascariensis TaxID=2747483 RepID=A0A8X6WRR6_9ARAC|nr:hypothetical protein TNIN_189261 [Trichonephila inaurata madagascariensis]